MMKIVTNKEYEYIAKIILEETFPQLYKSIEVRDKPDLYIDDNLGVEVTRALNENQSEMERLFYKYNGENPKALNDKQKKLLNKRSVELLSLNSQIIGFTSNDGAYEGIEELKNAYINKVQKIDGYKCKIINLFIFAFMVSLYDLNEIKKFVIWCKENYPQNPFHMVYIFQFDLLYCLDFANDSIKQHRFNAKEEWLYLTNKAKGVFHT